MSNRIKDVPGLPGVKSEAIASTISILYDSINPLNTTVQFAFQDYLSAADGSTVPFANGKYDLIPVKFSDLLDYDLPVSALDLMSAIRVAADLAYSKHFLDTPDAPVGT